MAQMSFGCAIMMLRDLDTNFCQSKIVIRRMRTPTIILIAIAIATKIGTKKTTMPIATIISIDSNRVLL